MIPPNPGPAPPDSDEDPDDGDQEEKTEDNDEVMLDASAPPASQADRLRDRLPSLLQSHVEHLQRLSSRRKTQWRPSVRDESNQGPRSPKDALVFSVEEARSHLPEFVVWDDLRLDLQLMIRSGVTYKTALDWISQDRWPGLEFRSEDSEKPDHDSDSDYNDKPEQVARNEKCEQKDAAALDDAVSEERLLSLVVLAVPSALCRPRTTHPRRMTNQLQKRRATHRSSQGSTAIKSRSSRSPSVKRTKSTKSPKRPANSVKSRHQSKLARKYFSELTLKELAVIEDPTRFPDYAPQKTEIYILADRWNEDEYRALITTEPWKEMFEARPKELYFHKREDLSVDTKHQLDKYVAFMEENARALWEILHWLIMKTRGNTTKETDASRGRSSYTSGVAIVTSQLVVVLNVA
ncbi:unnamed protein product [Phytophthora lilii]|uniref:Unnamed protein product n=1 Tax=Phytophthora lilii TaxID=2077276 RepID=A0A9W7CPE9_9STRA|nr:unnamed protein product [Phytophthora lilii]